MKRLSLVLAFMLVLSIGTGVMAIEGSLESGALLSGDVGVSLSILHYAQVELPSAIDLGEIDFADDTGFGKRQEFGVIRITTNDDIKVRMGSRGFQDREGRANPTLNKLVAYYYPGYSVSAHSFGAGGYKGPKEFMWESGTTNGKIEMRLDVFFSRTGTAEESWYLIRSGEYSDIVTVTVEAA
jgi:hypothetical protein